jgi:hypothetical protein
VTRVELGPASRPKVTRVDIEAALRRYGERDDMVVLGILAELAADAANRLLRRGGKVI